MTPRTREDEALAAIGRELQLAMPRDGSLGQWAMSGILLGLATAQSVHRGASAEQAAAELQALVETSIETADIIGPSDAPAPEPPTVPAVEGRCPACTRTSLHLVDGSVSCRSEHCHDRTAATDLLNSGAAYRLQRIAEAHTKDQAAGGTTSGECTECGHPHPCPTWVWAASDREPLSTWDPADDEPAVEPCTAGLMPTGDGPVSRCIVEGPHERHVDADGRRWTG